MEMLLVLLSGEGEKKMKPLSEAKSNVLAVKILGEGEHCATLNPSPHLGVFSKTNPHAHPHISGHPPLLLFW